MLVSFLKITRPLFIVIRLPLSVFSRLQSSRKPTLARSATKSHSSFSVYRYPFSVGCKAAVNQHRRDVGF